MHCSLDWYAVFTDINNLMHVLIVIFSTACSAAVYGTSPGQYPPSLTVAQPQASYAAQPPVVAGASAIPQFHTPAPTAPPPAQPQKRERRQLLIVNPETNQAVNVSGANAAVEQVAAAASVTHHRTPDGVAAQPVSDGRDGVAFAVSVCQ